MLANRKYIPILTIRPAEMVALQELPAKDKDLLLPLILLGGWVGAGTLEKSFDRVTEAYDDRPWIADINEMYMEKSNDREVFKELQELMNSSGGYKNWYDLIQSKPNLIPCLQLRDITQLPAQIDRFLSLGRGICVRFTPGMFTSIRPVLAQIAAKQVRDLCIILDHGQERYNSRQPDALTRAATIDTYVKQIVAVVPSASVVTSSTSFPIDFANGGAEQEIFERTVYNEVKRLNQNIPVIYSDRGSARAERTGGGGIPAPRIDYPLSNRWLFFREATPKPQGYYDAAAAAIANPNWNNDLNIWGTQMIKLTSLGDQYAISSPVRSTSVRINIHLHQQLYYDTPAELTNTDDDWED